MGGALTPLDRLKAWRYKRRIIRGLPQLIHERLLTEREADAVRKAHPVRDLHLIVTTIKVARTRSQSETEAHDLDTWRERSEPEQHDLLARLADRYRQGEQIRERAMTAGDSETAAYMTARLQALADIIDQMRAEAEER